MTAVDDAPTRPDRARYRRISVEPMTPTIGATVSGIELGTIDDETWAEVAAAFAEHLVLFFRDQHLEPPRWRRSDGDSASCTFIRLRLRYLGIPR